MVETLRAPTSERTQQLSEQGFTIDQSGRPLHPWIAERNMEFPEKSPLWLWGPNAAADAIVLNADAPQVLLIQRQDGTWANAGGFIDSSDESNAHAAAREALEEEGVILQPAEALPVYEGIVADTRSSRYSWITTAAFLWRTSLQLDQLSAGDDAKDIRLMNLSDARQRLAGSHNRLIDQAIERYGTLIEKLHYYANDGEIQPVTGGHMGYRHYINTLPTDQPVYVKQHAPELYTDTARAERSLMYLQKEAAVLQHLTANGYSHISHSAGYHNGTLAMEAFVEKDGWTWRHPKNKAEQTQYIQDTLQSLDTLSKIPIMEDSIGIAPSFTSFYEEGWNAYNANNRQQIITKLYEYAADIKSDSLSNAAYRLADNLDAIYDMAKAIDFDQPMVFCHHDFRESNFAWNQKQGTKIVDWSWAGPGFENSDTTTLLIDLHKRGATVTDYMERFNKDHALLMTGFWLLHGIWPGNGHTDVRFQQIHSAVAAYDLVNPHD